MVPIHPLELLALSTLYTSQEISHSWTTSSQGFTNKRSHKNPNTRTLSSIDTRKLGLKGALRICKFQNNGALKNTLPRLEYNQERFGKVKLFKQWRLKPFYRREKSN